MLDSIRILIDIYKCSVREVLLSLFCWGWAKVQIYISHLIDLGECYGTLLWLWSFLSLANIALHTIENNSKKLSQNRTESWVLDLLVLAHQWWLSHDPHVPSDWASSRHAITFPISYAKVFLLSDFKSKDCHKHRSSSSRYILNSEPKISLNVSVPFARFIFFLCPGKVWVLAWPSLCELSLSTCIRSPPVLSMGEGRLLFSTVSPTSCQGTLWAVC